MERRGFVTTSLVTGLTVATEHAAAIHTGREGAKASETTLI